MIRFIFLNGPNGSGKSTLAQAWVKLRADYGMLSFAEPGREALLITFYPEQFLSATDAPNLKDASIKNSALPVVRRKHGEQFVTHHEWMIWFLEDQKRLFGDDIWGQVALRRFEENAMFYTRVIFDDLRWPYEMKPFAEKFGSDSCLTVHVSRDGQDWRGVGNMGAECASTPGRHLRLLNNGTIEESVGQLCKEVEK